MADIQPVETNPKNSREMEIKKIKIPHSIRKCYDSELDKLYLNVVFADETEGIISMPFDEYFRMFNDIWSDMTPIPGDNLVTMKTKMEDAAPYNVFFTPLMLCPDTNEQLYTASFADLLCPSLGKLKSSFHITFMADIMWILEQFALGKLHNLPMTVMYGYTGFPWPKKATMDELYPNLDYHHIEVKQSETALGCHHTKLSIFVYDDDSLRVVIGSVNLFKQDWELYNQHFLGEENLDSNAPKSDEPTELPPAGTSDSRNVPVNKWDEITAESTKSTETKKKDMKFNARPKTDMFFPSFKKKV